MKKFLLKFALPVSLSLLAGQIACASPTVASHSFGKGNDFIHATTIHIDGDPVVAEGTLYLGTKSGSTCDRISPVGFAYGVFTDGFVISAPSELFDGAPLDSNSCAVEEFVMEDSGKAVAIDYTLINDGERVTGADPSQSDITFPTRKKK